MRESFLFFPELKKTIQQEKKLKDMVENPVQLQKSYVLQRNVSCAVIINMSLIKLWKGWVLFVPQLI